MAVEQGNLQFLLQRRNLAADGGLGQAQCLARMGEGPGLGGHVKNLELVPVHHTLPLGRDPVLLSQHDLKDRPLTCWKRTRAPTA